MIAWLLACGIFACLVWGVYHGVTTWQSPWAVPVPAVMGVLPDQPAGCGKACQ